MSLSDLNPARNDGLSIPLDNLVDNSRLERLGSRKAVRGEHDAAEGGRRETVGEDGVHSSGERSACGGVRTGRMRRGGRTDQSRARSCRSRRGRRA